MKHTQYRNAAASLLGQGVEAVYPDFFFRDVVADDPEENYEL